MLNKELLLLLEQGKKRQAIQLYAKKTGKNLDLSRQYIEKLYFFYIHELATEEDWKNAVEAKKQQTVFKIFMVFYLLFIFHGIPFIKRPFF